MNIYSEKKILIYPYHKHYRKDYSVEVIKLGLQESKLLFQQFYLQLIPSVVKICEPFFYKIQLSTYSDPHCYMSSFFSTKLQIYSRTFCFPTLTLPENKKPPNPKDKSNKTNRNAVQLTEMVKRLTQAQVNVTVLSPRALCKGLQKMSQTINLIFNEQTQQHSLHKHIGHFLPLQSFFIWKSS